MGKEGVELGICDTRWLVGEEVGCDLELGVQGADQDLLGHAVLLDPHGEEASPLWMFDTRKGTRASKRSRVAKEGAHKRQPCLGYSSVCLKDLAREHLELANESDICCYL